MDWPNGKAHSACGVSEGVGLGAGTGREGYWKKLHFSSRIALRGLLSTLPPVHSPWGSAPAALGAALSALPLLSECPVVLFPPKACDCQSMVCGNCGSSAPSPAPLP